MRTHVLFRAVACAAALLTAAACQDDGPTGPGEEPDGSLLAPASVRTVPRFAVNLEATGSFRPGQPIQITVTAEALIATQDARVEIVLPEEASARMRGGYDNFRRERETTLPAAASRSLSMGRGERVVERYTVTFPRPGYYSVWGSARSDETAVVDSGIVQNESHKGLFIYVDEQGGRLTEQFDPSLLPATAARELGPLRERPGVRQRPANLTRPPRGSGGGGSASSSLRTSRVARQISGGSYEVVVDYYDTGTSRYTPVGFAEYYLYFYDANFNYLNYETAFMPAGGSLLIGCNEAYYIEIEVYTWNDRVTVGEPADFRTGRRIVQSGTYPQSDCPRGRIEPYVEAVPAHVFVSMDKTARNTTAFFGRSRPRVPVVLVYDSVNKPSFYCPVNATPGCGHGSDDYVRINKYVDPTPNGYGDQIWGRAAVFVQAHEYGHAFHQKALGGFTSYYPGCPGHSMLTLSNLPCALVEGFANYFAIVTRPNETGYDDYWERNYYHLNYVGATSDGSRSESAVSSFFYDITDSDSRAAVGDELHDNVAYSGTALAEVITTCKALQSGTYVQNNGVDHVIWCMERQVDPAITGSTAYFPTRSPDPTGYQVTSSTVMNRTEVRRLWKRNLYNQ